MIKQCIGIILICIICMNWLGIITDWFSEYKTKLFIPTIAGILVGISLDLIILIYIYLIK